MPRTPKLNLQFSKTCTPDVRRVAYLDMAGSSGRWWVDVEPSVEGRITISYNRGKMPRGK